MALDLVLPRRTDGADETLGDFIRRRLGREALDKLGEPLVAGIHSGDPETMSIKATFPRFVDMEREDRSLIVAMLKRMRAVRKARAAAAASTRRRTCPPRPPRTMFMTLDEGLGELMTELTRAGRRGRAAHVRARERPRGPSRRWLDGADRDRVRRTRPTGSYSLPLRTRRREILREIDPELAGELDAIPYVSSATVTLAYPASLFPTHLDGFGLVIPKGEHRRVKAFTWVTSKFYGRAPADVVLMRCFIRATAGETDGLSEEDMAEMARAELADILGVVGSAALVACLPLGSGHAAVRGGPPGARGAHRRTAGRPSAACGWRVEPTRARASPTRSASAGRRRGRSSTI